MAALPLPIDPLLPQAIAAVKRRGALVLSAEPGAGKTTRVPRALLDAGIEGEIVVLEPRRLAARLAAERVAEEHGSPVGEVVGYETRFERAVGKTTRIRFVTEGILARRLLSSPTLAEIGAVVLDEIHERHLAGDVALAMLRRLRKSSRPDLALVAMSATLEADRVAAFLDAETLHAPGRVFPVELEHEGRADDRPLSARVKSAVRDLVARGADGHILVFLPGAREIRFAEQALAELAAKEDLVVLPLHGSLSVEEQNRAVRPSQKRKVILSTNVAETSVTIDGVSAVVDSGLALVASCAPWSGLPTLTLSKISKASATQRAGRAGRTRAGVCVRLYTAGDLGARPAFDAPEIARLDLAETVLELAAHGVASPESFEWLDAPPRASLEAAVTLLRKLEALRGADDALALTDVGRRMLAFPCHPRQSRVIVEAESRGLAREAAGIAAIIGERGFSDAPVGTGHEKSDLTALLADLDGSSGARVDPSRAAPVRRVRAQLERIARDRAPAPDFASRERILRESILLGYPDRVGRIRRADRQRPDTEVIFAAGGSAILSDRSRALDTDLVVAVDVEERVEGRRTKSVVRLASAIDTDWLLDHFTDAITEEDSVSIAPGTGRVETSRTMRFGQLVLDERKSRASDPDQIARALADALLAKGLSAEQLASLERLEVKLELVKKHAPERDLGPAPLGDTAALVLAACAGAETLAEARALDLGEAALAGLPQEAQRALRELVPDKVTLPGGRSVRVEYERTSPPWISSRMQDFFGMADGPRILSGRVPLVLHLAAPSGRAQQVTTDLAGFWDRHYPAIAKELRRKYPRHAWPDDPRTARPPEPRPRHGGDR
jgi:ATP-dependent helicase HrpB